MSAIHTYKIIYTPTVDAPSRSKTPERSESDSIPSHTDSNNPDNGTPINPLKETDELVDDSLSIPPAQRFKKWKLSVTDFSAQLWCETQLYKALVTGYRRETQAMRDGIARHEKLEADDHMVIDVEVTTREDNLGLRLLNTIIAFTQLLPLNQKVREVWLVGTPLNTQCVVRGVVDEFAMLKDSGQPLQVVIKDTKTRREEVEPSMSQKRTSAMQLQLYHMMIEDIQNETLDWDSIWRAFKVDPTKHFDHELFKEYATTLTGLARLFVEAVQNLPPLADYVVVEYDCNGKIFKSDRIPYSKSVTLYTLNNLLAWWVGNRKTEGVIQSERWKCKQCDFLSCCTATPLDPDEKRAIVEERQMAELTLGLSDIESPLTCASAKALRMASPQGGQHKQKGDLSAEEEDGESFPPSKTQDLPRDQSLPRSSSQKPRDDASSEVAPYAADLQRKAQPKRTLPHFDPTGVSPQRKQPTRMEGSKFLASRFGRSKSKTSNDSERSLMFLNSEFASVFK